MQAGTKRVLVARQDGRIIGTVQLELAMPPNQRHRAEVNKMLVHPGLQRRGIARALMVALEDAARAEGRTLLTLDTWTGSHAEKLYSVPRLRDRRRDSALRQRLDHQGTRAGDDHVQRAGAARGA